MEERMMATKARLTEVFRIENFFGYPLPDGVKAVASAGAVSNAAFTTLAATWIIFGGWIPSDIEFWLSLGETKV